MTRKDRVNLLNQAFGHFQHISQWLPNDIDSANHYDSMAIAIIELLEVDMFGGTRGTYKRGYQPKYEPCGYRNYDRFYYIIKEGKFEKDIKRVCYFGVEDLYQYYKRLSELRESFNN